MVVVGADRWALLLHLEIGDAVRGRMRMVAEVVAASEVEEVVTSDLLRDVDVSLDAGGVLKQINV